MTSEAEMRFLKEFGPRVAALVNRLQEAAGVRELRNMADLDIFAAAALELLTSALANMPEPMRGERVRGVSETLTANAAEGFSLNLDRGEYRQAAGAGAQVP